MKEAGCFNARPGHFRTLGRPYGAAPYTKASFIVYRLSFPHALCRKHFPRVVYTIKADDNCTRP